MLRRPTALLAALATAAALGSCSVVGGARERVGSGPAPTVTPQAPPPGSEGLERFYTQALAWSECDGGRCASLTVPLSYDDPDGATIGVDVLKVPASKRSARVGSLVVNPGGPGGSGVDYARAADVIVGAPVRQRYDVVGFDPRGVGRSEPIDCLTDSELDAFLGAEQTPDDPAEQAAFAANATRFAEACGDNAGPLLGHVSTVDAARDMDVLRSALGEEQLDYLGKSYGTYLGAVYAGLFPTLVGRFVLDGALAPDLTSRELNLGQAEGFERATRAWAASCVEEGDCPLGDSVDSVMEGMRAFLGELDLDPIQQTGDPSVPELTEAWASTGIAAAMYDEGSWPILSDALRDATAGDGTALMQLAYQYADRRPGGGYTSNLMEVIYAVNCLDRPESSSVAEHAKEARESTATAPTWGPLLMWSTLPCGSWPVTDAGSRQRPPPITAEGSGPIVVVGTTRDPATPYEWAVRLRDQLANASLLTYEGDGHTAYTRSNACVDDAIDAYYVKGTVPKDGLRC
ncbi:MAG TPA: alpha/beta hydrolase [Dermatophilaceae bacterium]|nr:alpha/beta hydrolase [Dermatophilaceae bacterium]